MGSREQEQPQQQEQEQPQQQQPPPRKRAAAPRFDACEEGCACMQPLARTHVRSTHAHTRTLHALRTPVTAHAASPACTHAPRHTTPHHAAPPPVPEFRDPDAVVAPPPKAPEPFPLEPEERLAVARQEPRIGGAFVNYSGWPQTRVHTHTCAHMDTHLVLAPGVSPLHASRNPPSSPLRHRHVGRRRRRGLHLPSRLQAFMAGAWLCGSKRPSGRHCCVASLHPCSWFQC